ncbi:hypothetical protein ACOMHN_019588 [Nucella lapillus]
MLALGIQIIINRVSNDGFHCFTAVSTVGVLTPEWLQFKSPTPFNIITRQGLFLECSRSPQAVCTAVDLLEVRGFEMWTHVLLSMGVIALFVSSFFIIVFNLGSKSAESRLKMVEGFAVYGGFFILIGIVNYVANASHTWDYSYGYAFFLTVLSSLLAVTGGALVALFNRKSHAPDHVGSYVEAGKVEEEEEAEEEARASCVEIKEVVL